MDSVVTYDSPSGFMSLQDIEDMNILVDVDFSSDDELPDLILEQFCSDFFYVAHATCKLKKIAVFVISQVLTMSKTDTKVKNQVLINILHCSVDREMVLRAQELAPSGIMLVILSLKASIYKQSKAFELLAPERVWSSP